MAAYVFDEPYYIEIYDFEHRQKENFIMTRTLIIERGQKLAEEQLKEVDEVKKSYKF